MVGITNFEVPGLLTSDLVGSASLETKARGISQFFSASSTISFPLRIPAHALGEFTFVGAGGSWLRLVVCAPYTVALYQKDDLAGISATLIKSLLAANYWVNERLSPAGANSETNAIYFGNGVPFPTAQKVLGLVSAAGIPIKWVQYLPLRDSNEIQVGSWNACVSRSALDASRLAAMAAAESEQQFKSEIGTIPDCAK